jgi:SAM-dependent methyltransferase
MTNTSGFLANDVINIARTHWGFGDWENLINFSLENIQDNSKYAELALLIAAAQFQIGNAIEATRLFRVAQDHGIYGDMANQVLISGVHNNLGRAAAMFSQWERASKHFESAINITAPEKSKKLLTEARVREQMHQLGLPDHACKNITKQLENLEKYDRISSKQLEYIGIGETINNSKFSSASYWQERYIKGGNSGYGSYGRLAEFKARVINKFVADNMIQSVIEFGCGDGNQLAMFQIENYIGLDVSEFIINACKEKFKGDPSKIFLSVDEHKNKLLNAKLSLSLDVIFHLVEDDIFSDYIKMLFDAAEKYCIIYACDEYPLEQDAVHIYRRKFTDWIVSNIDGWRLMQVIYNDYPHDGTKNPRDFSFSNFYFYKRIDGLNP